VLLVKRWLPAVIIMLFLFTSSSLPGASVSAVKSVDAFVHKVTHIIIYMLLCLTFYRATKNPFMSVLLTIIYGVFDEYHQLFTFTRSGNVIDIMVDSMSAFFIGLILWKFYLVLPKTLKNWLEQ